MSAALERDLGWMPRWERGSVLQAIDWRDTRSGVDAMVQQRVAELLREVNHRIEDELRVHLISLGWTPPPD